MDRRQLGFDGEDVAEEHMINLVFYFAQVGKFDSVLHLNGTFAHTFFQCSCNIKI